MRCVQGTRWVCKNGECHNIIHLNDDTLIEQIIQAPNREQLVLRTQVLDRLLRAGYYQIPTYGKGENWFAYWNMYHQPKVKPKLSAGIDYWWSDAAQAKKVAHYSRQK